MAWKRGNPGDPCCKEPECECPEGGTSRKFKGDPLIVVTISDMIPSYSFHAVWSADTFSGFVYAWDYVTLHGLDNLNGTYVQRLNAVSGGCINYSSFGGGAVGSAEYGATTVRRMLDGPSGCNVLSEQTLEETLPVSIRNYYQPWPPFVGIHRVNIDGTSWYYLPGAFNGQSTWGIVSTQRLKCSTDYDPLVDTDPIYTDTMGTISGTGYVPPPLAAEQKLWLLHTANPEGRCASPYSSAYVELGTFSAEMIDDVP